MTVSTVRAALTELVACKALKDAIDRFDPSVDDSGEGRARYKDYQRRKEPAWLQARIALAERAVHPVEINSMALANAITKALYPDLYGKDIRMLAVRETVRGAINAELAMQAEVFE